MKIKKEFLKETIDYENDEFDQKSNLNDNKKGIKNYFNNRRLMISFIVMIVVLMAFLVFLTIYDAWMAVILLLSLIIATAIYSKVIKKEQFELEYIEEQLGIAKQIRKILFILLSAVLVYKFWYILFFAIIMIINGLGKSPTKTKSRKANSFGSYGFGSYGTSSVLKNNIDIESSKKNKKLWMKK